MKAPHTKDAASVSPYTLQNVDAAIADIEQVLCAEGADSLFVQAYWRGRALQAYATPGLAPTQRERLQRLLAHLPTGSKVSSAGSASPEKHPPKPPGV
ncbi:hypothetical protein SAMN05446635_9950 [Burkholderia sp. OK233]|nr:hypothetical protein SAMN05446635_9950 [Burkholderia sp. OK233]